jgi:hypothetical protein
VLPKTEGDHVLHLRLTLSPIAGFKGETSEDGDPDNAPRLVDLGTAARLGVRVQEGTFRLVDR